MTAGMRRVYTQRIFTEAEETRLEELTVRYSQLSDETARNPTKPSN